MKSQQKAPDNCRFGHSNNHVLAAHAIQDQSRDSFRRLDPAGVIYTPRVAHFVVEAALEFLSYALKAPAARCLFAMGIFPPARALSIEFLHPMVWDQRIDIEVCVKEIRDHSFSLVLVACNTDSEITFRATITQVCVSPETKHSVLLPDALRTALERMKDN